MDQQVLKLLAEPENLMDVNKDVLLNHHQLEAPLLFNLLQLVHAIVKQLQDKFVEVVQQVLQQNVVVTEQLNVQQDVHLNKLQILVIVELLRFPFVEMAQLVLQLLAEQEKLPFVQKDAPQINHQLLVHLLEEHQLEAHQLEEFHQYLLHNQSQPAIVISQQYKNVEMDLQLS